MIQSIFILNNSGDIIIEKHYKGFINRSICDYFLEEIFKKKDVLPIISTPKYYLINIQRENLYFLAVIPMESPPLLVIEFLQRIGDIFIDYFEKINENIIRENFVLIYQILDEMMDNGFPFTTEPNSLMSIIPPPNTLKKIVSGITGQSSLSGQLPDSTISNTPWRKMGVKYSNNEIYFDINEELNATVESNGMSANMEVLGEVLCQCHLSGMPDLTLIFSNPHILDDVSFHPCVRYSRYEQQKVISFVPPDGNFKLMTYRVKGQLQLPIYVKPQISLNQSGGKVSIMVGTKTIQGKNIEDVVITIPFPKYISTINLTPSYGQINFDDITKVCRWIIGKLPKEKSPLLEGTVISSISSSTSTPSSPATNSSNSDTSIVLQVEFKISMFTVSTLKVESLQVHNEPYKPYKGVKTLTKAGKFHVRT